MAYRYLKHNEKLLSLNGKLVKIETTEPTKTPETKTVTPTTTQQEITPTNSNYELSKVIVNGVTSSIDSNITPENIKKDITILGITGTCESGGSNDLKEILLGEWVHHQTDAPLKIVIVFSADDTCGIWTGKHEPSTVTLDMSYTISGNTISVYEADGDLYCTGTYENNNYVLTLSLEDTGGNIIVFTKILKNNLQEKTITPTTEQQIIYADSDYEALKSVTVDAVTADIDSNIIADNIKKDVTILGVTGTYESSTDTGITQDILLGEWGTNDAGNIFFFRFKADNTCDYVGRMQGQEFSFQNMPYTISDYIVTIDGTNTDLNETFTCIYTKIDGVLRLSMTMSSGDVMEVTKNIKTALQSKTVTPSTSEQTVFNDSGDYDGLLGVTVEAIPTNYVDATDTTKINTKTITENGTYSASDDNLTAYSSVTVDVNSGSITNEPILGDIVGDWKYTDSESGGYYLLTLNEDYSGTLTMNDGTTSNSYDGTFTLSGSTINFTYSGNTLEYTVKVSDNKRILNQTLGNLQFNKLTPTLTYDETSGTLTITYGGN